VVELGDGGGTLAIDGAPHPLTARREYPAIYARFAELIKARSSEVDREPLRVVADAFTVGEHLTVEPFDWKVAAN